MVEFEPNRAYGFLGNRISDDNLGTEGRKEGRKEGQTDREMVNYSMICVMTINTVIMLYTELEPTSANCSCQD